ncbi:carbohydrate ABC transporter permease [Kutzneria kofuensis]|uniref:Multiple sugar transport system permease protein n=1 Tax=Kutzneria kofuensis TaxID=103725 RepID=A0A7W9KRN8_9PSEU|nr:carbohydrate ABC transporter permease [Kutzneria kofuensis]MBB5897385.1 multiple sugar transport system permease protein [Kutzneria kofuensis]
MRTAIAIVLLAVMLFPLYWMVDASLQTNQQIADREPHWLPFGGTLDGYRDALGQQGGHLVVSVIVALGTVVLTLLIAAPAAYGLSRRNSRPVLFTLLIVQLIPGIVMANALYRVFSTLGVLNSPEALVLADSTLAVPFAVLIMRAFMLSVPKELVEAAGLDGAGAVRTFVTIVLPVSRNGVVTAGLFAFLFSWGDFMFASTLNLGAPNWTPITVGLYDFIGAGTNTTSWNSVMATGVLASLPVAVLLVVAQRHVSAGLAAGAVKD